MRWLLRLIKALMRRVIIRAVPEIGRLSGQGNDYNLLSWVSQSEVSDKAKLYPLHHVVESKIGDYTYVARNSNISLTEIGKFCSIGPNFLCGWGIHPLDGISTAPMFYSTMKQNGMTLSATDKVVERKPIRIGNDVFIGANVIVLDGVTIGDGAVIGAGAVVSKDIPPYAVAVGCPIRIIRYRFDEVTVKRIRQLEWWNGSVETLKDVEKFFYDIEAFMDMYEKKLGGGNSLVFAFEKAFWKCRCDDGQRSCAVQVVMVTLNAA